jgi:hypothetical protein
VSGVRAPRAEAARTFAAALASLDDELDWSGLGAAYCEGDARDFFDGPRRAALVEVGLQLADDVSAGLPGAGPGRSLYLGAAVAELVPILAERLVLGREVLWSNRPGPELDELRRALVAVGGRLGLELPRPSSAALVELPPGACDHLWMVSVLSDPDSFPALHDALYERAGTALGTGRGDPAAERRRAEVLVAQLLDRGASACVLTTTDEELQLVRPLARTRGWALEVPARGRRSALVGDVVRVCRLERSQAQL